MSETSSYLNYVPHDILVSETSKNKMYRDTNILDNILSLVENVHQTILNSAGDYRGFWFIILYPVIMVLGVVPRSLFYVARELCKPCFDYKKQFPLNTNANIADSFNVEMREKSNTITDNYSSSRETKITKANSINSLRREIYTNNMKLEGNFVSDDCLTFGTEMNKTLNSLFPSLVEFKVNALTGEKSVVVKDINLLRIELNKLFCENIKIILS